MRQTLVKVSMFGRAHCAKPTQEHKARRQHRERTTGLGRDGQAAWTSGNRRAFRGIAVTTFPPRLEQRPQEEPFHRA